MSKPFFVDCWTMDGQNGVRKHRSEYMTESEALDCYRRSIELVSSSRVVVRKRGFTRGSSSAIKVWEKPL